MCRFGHVNYMCVTNFNMNLPYECGYTVAIIFLYANISGHKTDFNVNIVVNNKYLM